MRAPLQSANGLSVDNAQASGALSSEAITEADIRAGRFDAAQIHHWLVDWTRTDLRILMFMGSFGEIRRHDGRFEVELRGLAQALNVAVGRSILRGCDRVLGDAKCGFDLGRPGFTAEMVVEANSTSSRILCRGATGIAGNWYAGGKLEWLSGGNAGLTSVVKIDRVLGGGGRSLGLWNKTPSGPATGDRFKLLAGCDKQAGTCRTKFSNFLNFRGFPHVPGEDWVTAYPREGGVYDGGSQQG